MRLEDFLNKTVELELKDSTLVQGLLLDITDIDDEEEGICETRLTIRVESNDYKIIDINEIETIGEIF